VELYELSITEAHRLLQTKKISSVELTRSVLYRIGAAEPTVDAFITLLEKQALEEAIAADRAIAAGKAGR
jgi:aspartyl-tRNA(Asn)/glutamyl-tRNA(Gln) amidotransferase subunit A